MMNTQSKGSITELKIAAKLIERGYTVCMPYGNNARYDLVIEKNGKFERIQCKTSHIEEKCIRFNTTSQHILTGERFTYETEIEYFGVYSPELDKCYLVPSSLGGKSSIGLRIEPAKFNKKSIKWAKDFEL